MRPNSAGPGQESVWSYPRPPRVEASERRIRVRFAGVLIADSRQALRLLETSHPPTWYIPTRDLRMDLLEANERRSVCEFKGAACYYDIVVGERRSANAGWSYPAPRPSYAQLAGHLCFYASRVDGAWVDDERVIAQPGDFYGGWVTSDVAGPFKGPPGTRGW